MTVETNLPKDNDQTGAPSRRFRAPGRVMLGRDSRLELSSVPLRLIRPHLSIQARNTRLDLAPVSTPVLGDLDAACLDIAMCAAPPWVLARGAASDRHYLLLAGGQFIPQLRRMLPPDASVIVVLVDGKFSEPRILQFAAAHSASLAAAASAFTAGSLSAVLDDASKAGSGVLKTRNASDFVSDLEARPLSRRP